MKDLSNRPVESISQIKAVLGPTNTGKTHLAVERMLGHASGMIGLPLRLLAREIYDRVVKSRGVSNVALITGEEKIVPKNASAHSSTFTFILVTSKVLFVIGVTVPSALKPQVTYCFKSLSKAPGRCN